MSHIVIAGAGPAGIAAANAASRSAHHVTIIDDNPAIGGQIWRGRKLSVGGTALLSTRIVDARPGWLLAESEDRAREITYDKLILATGARELFLPFPGWTLPNVMGAGGLQALVKGGLPIRDKRVVVAGSGPLLLAVAAYLKKEGATVPLIAEQAAQGSIARFLLKLMGAPGKLWQAAWLRAQLASVAYETGTWITAAHGSTKVEEVTVGSRKIRCDYVACGFGLVPNTELAQVLGCRIDRGFVAVDDLQRTSAVDVYCAGEPTGIGGVHLAVVEGEIAGYAAVGDEARARALFGKRDAARRFAAVLSDAFRIRPEVIRIATPDTIVCRCEDVPLSSLQPFDSWRAAKLHTRCGMGPCQGRICGAAVEAVFGWNVDSVRPPVFPVKVGAFRQ
jgi:NADPH-dependent 2,4-dienoyl-CoA reductase/sulfur reductase-like enzyme